MDPNNISMGEKIAAGSGVALFFIMFLFDWFGNDFGGVDAWRAFTIIDLILFITLAAAIGLAVMSAMSQSPNLPVAMSAIVAGLGILATLLVLIRIISPPDLGAGQFADVADIGRQIGVFLGLLAAAGIAYGGWTAMQEENTSFGDQADRFQNRGGGGTSGGSTPPTADRTDRGTGSGGGTTGGGTPPPTDRGTGTEGGTGTTGGSPPPPTS